MTITHISDTARWVALYRARESERPDALFHDAFARRLAGPEGERMVRRLETRMTGDWPVVVRTAIMDEIILRLVRSGVRRVLNLAAGLDARPWRLALPKTLRWIDVDLAGILDHKLRVLAGESTKCQYAAERIDLTDVGKRRKLLARLGEESRETLVLTEGLLVYLDAETVAALAHDFHAMPGWQVVAQRPRQSRLAPAGGSTAREKGHHIVRRDLPVCAGEPSGLVRFPWVERGGIPLDGA